MSNSGYVEYRYEGYVEYRYEVGVGGGRCNGSVFVPQDATDDEIRLAILDDLYEVWYEPVEELTYEAN